MNKVTIDGADSGHIGAEPVIATWLAGMGTGAGDTPLETGAR